MMETWKGRHVVIVGAARQGTALARYLVGKGARVTLTDRKKKDEMVETQRELQDLDVKWVLGGHPLHVLDDADALALSGGVPLDIPLVQEAQKQGIPLTNDSQIFLDRAPCLVVGITGSAGKTTTTILLGRMIKEHVGARHTWVGGNVGNPLISVVEMMNEGDIAVVELSSFQLQLMTTSPQVAAVLNLTPNHLDRHGTMEAYTAAKTRILTNQSARDVAVLNRDDPGSWSLRDHLQGDLISFGLQRPGEGDVGTYLERETIALWDRGSSRELFPAQQIQLRGQHNMTNVLAACALAYAVDLPPEAMAAGVRGFRGVEHRLEFVGSHRGADWYNDSIATAPERAVAAMESFDEPIVLLAGGRDKDLPWDGFARAVKDHVRTVILFGEAVPVIARALAKAGLEDRIQVRCSGLCKAVRAAAKAAQPGDVVLLAPGGTSFDEFKDFAERGDYFKQWVNELR